MTTQLKGLLGLWTESPSAVLGKLHAIQQAGFDDIVVRIVVHSPVPEANALEEVTLTELIDDAATIGMPVVAWAYAYPNLIEQQVSTIANVLNANQSITDLVLDCEVEWEGSDPARADAFFHGIAEATGHRVNLHLSTFDNPSEHPGPWAQMLQHCASMMPQSYQIGGTPVETVMQRTLTESLPLAQKSLGGLLIPTVNTPAVLTALAAKATAYKQANAEYIDGVNAWLYETSGTDTGVEGHEADWATAIAAWKEAVK